MPSNNYESTMNVSGQPRWLVPNTYARSGYELRPLGYKTVGNTDQSIIADVFRQNGRLVHKGLKLIRDASEVEKTIETGPSEHILIMNRTGIALIRWTVGLENTGQKERHTTLKGIFWIASAHSRPVCNPGYKQLITRVFQGKLAYV